MNMSFHEAKEQVAKKHGKSSFYALLCLTLQPSKQLDLMDEVFELWQTESCKETWNRACEAQKLVCEDEYWKSALRHDNYIPEQNNRIATAPNAEYKP